MIQQEIVAETSFCSIRFNSNKLISYTLSLYHPDVLHVIPTKESPLT